MSTALLFAAIRAAGLAAAEIPTIKDAGPGVVFHRHDREMHITIDGHYFATYVWDDPETTRPYFKQVHAIGGDVQLTRNHPPEAGDYDDHETYHPGIWWGFGDVGGNDYWRMKAKVVGGEFIEPPQAGADHGYFAVKNRCLTADGSQTFCTQVCRYTFWKRPAGILLICESSFQRDDADFWLGDQEEMGLALRVATPLTVKAGKGGRYVDDQGHTLRKELRTNQGQWCDYSGPVAGKFGGLTLMNDPSNFRKPWWHAVETGLLVANPLGESELSGQGKKRQNVLVKQGTPFRLRYGVLVHAHEAADQYDPAQAYEDFLGVLKRQ